MFIFVFNLMMGSFSPFTRHSQNYCTGMDFCKGYYKFSLPKYISIFLSILRDGHAAKHVRCKSLLRSPVKIPIHNITIIGLVEEENIGTIPPPHKALKIIFP